MVYPYTQSSLFNQELIIFYLVVSSNKKNGTSYELSTQKFCKFIQLMNQCQEADHLFSLAVRLARCWFFITFVSLQWQIVLLNSNISSKPLKVMKWPANSMYISRISVYNKCCANNFSSNMPAYHWEIQLSFTKLDITAKKHWRFTCVVFSIVRFWYNSLSRHLCWSSYSSLKFNRILVCNRSVFIVMVFCSVHFFGWVISNWKTSCIFDYPDCNLGWRDVMSFIICWHCDHFVLSPQSIFSLISYFLHLFFLPFFHLPSHRLLSIFSF